MLKCVFFDFDGVIADSEPVHYEMFRQVLLPLAINLTWKDYSEKYLGYTDAECFQHIFEDLGRTISPAQIQELVQIKNDRFEEFIRKNSIVFPGVVSLLQDLQKHQIFTAICSGALRREIRVFLSLTGLLDYFAFIIGAEDVEKGKPDPQGYRLALQKANEVLNANPPIPPSQCIVIEDSMWGIDAAKKAGMFCLAVAHSYPPDQLSQADRIVQTLAELNAPRLMSCLANP